MATETTKTATKTTARPSVFEVLSKIDCSKHIEHKSNGKTELSYLSWAWAWHIAKEHYPSAFYTIYERDGQIPYFTDGRTCWVKTGVTIEGLEHIEYLPVMDYRNASIPLDKVTSMDINKAIQRSLTKACARHGLGLYIYAGEDLPEAPQGSTEAAQEAGQKRLDELNTQMAKGGESAQQSHVRGPATDEQKQFIREHADDETYVKAMQAFGADLENMTQAQANKLIARINLAMERASNG